MACANGGEGIPLAVQVIRDALIKAPQDASPEIWAMCQNALGIALQDQGTRSDGETSTKPLAEAVTAFRDALTVYTRADHPVQWAKTQNNLAIALRNQATRTGGDTGTTLLADAVTAYRDALTVTTRTDHPVHWALTQFNLALCELARATHDATADPASHLRAAMEHVEAALAVFDPEHMPYDFNKATNLRDKIKARLSGE